MAYSDFTLRKVKQAFDLQTVEGGRFLPPTSPLEPSEMLRELIASYLPWAIAVGSEKAKSEMIVSPIVYGATTSGTAWRFLQIQDKTVTIDLTDYPLPPLDNILGVLAWMVEAG